MPNTNMPYKEPTNLALQCRLSVKKEQCKQPQLKKSPNILQFDIAVKVARAFETSFKHYTKPEK